MGEASSGEGCWCVAQLVSSPRWQTLRQGGTKFHCVDVEFEEPVNHPKEDVEQAVGMDLELGGEGLLL